MSGVDILIIAISAFMAAGLTFFSGFGLGTLLMPVMAFFMPVELAVAVTALVHLANNLFKLGLVGLRADLAVVLRFGVTAILAAYLGALTLGWLSNLPSLAEYSLAGRQLSVTPVKLMVGLLMLVFLLVEFSPAAAGKRFSPSLLPLGGCLSGFFGGLTGNQGAFRSMFLLKAGLSKEQFIATGVVLAVLVDLARLHVYAGGIQRAWASVESGLLAAAVIAAFAGSLLGSRLLEKVTIITVQRTVAVMLAFVAAGFISGVL